MSLADLNPFDLDHLEDPYELYNRLRDTAPVHLVPEVGLYLVSRHADVFDAASRYEDFSSNLTAFVQSRSTGDRSNASDAELIEFGGGGGVVDVLATADRPDHTRQRKVVARTFREIETAQPMVTEVVDEMLRPFIADGGGDWIDRLATRLPVRVIASLLGLPSDDADQLKQWSDDGVELLSGVATPERLAECGASVFRFIQYLEHQLAISRESAPDGILAILRGAVDDGEISMAEARSMALQLVSAGSDSTGNLIGSAARMLAEQPEIQAQVRAEPDLVPVFVEEVVRLESPFRGHFRVATHDTSLAGTELVEGARLLLMWASANRDPAVFDRPDEIVLDRENPQRHLGFGWGIHTCVGAPLARLEAQVAVTGLLDSTADIRPAPGAPPPAHIPSILVRRLAYVHLELVPAG